jgi:uncharacterized protein YqgC (DUF456 family)
MEGSTLLLITAGVMFITAFIALIPMLPGPVMVWFIGVLYAILTGFEQVSVTLVIIMTVIMGVGATTEFWLPLFGLRGKGMSCLGAVGSIIGGIIGGFVIPIPILGSIIGMLVGALIVEFARIRELQHALSVGKHTLQVYLLSVVIEFVLSLVIIGVFLLALWNVPPV